MTGRDLPDVLSMIAVHARRTNLIRVGTIRTALQQSTSDGLDPEGWSSVERTAHQLAGSAGTFGYASASDLARQLERVLAALAAGGAVPDPGRLAEAVGLLDQLTVRLSAEPELD